MDADPILREYDARRAVFRAFAERMDFVIRESLSRAKIRTQSIEHRVKERNSLLSKLSRPGATYSCLNDVTDVCGVRVITYFATDVDRIGEVLKKEFIVDASNSTDKRIYTDPDRFGYRSLHYVLSMSPDRTALSEYAPFAAYKGEIQIRTVIQHAWAEIEHDLGYKTALAVPRHVKRRLFRLAAMLELADEEFTAINDSLVEYREQVEQNLKRDITSIPIDATSISEFIRTDSLLKQLDQQIANQSKCVITPLKEPSAAALATWLNYVGFHLERFVQI